PRLIVRIAPAVAQAAMTSGVATRPITDLDAYRHSLDRFAYQSGGTMEPLFEAAKKSPKRVAYAEGEEERVLRAVQIVIDEGIARAVVIGREDVITARIKSFGLRMKLGTDVECINVNDDARYNEVWNQYYRLTARKGVTRSIAKAEVRTRPTLIGAMLIR